MKSSAQNPTRKDYLVANIDAFAVVLASLLDLGMVATGRVDEDDRWGVHRDLAARSINLILEMLFLSDVDAVDLSRRVMDNLSDMHPNATNFNRAKLEEITSMVFRSRELVVKADIARGDI